LPVCVRKGVFLVLMLDLESDAGILECLSRFHKGIDVSSEVLNHWEGEPIVSSDQYYIWVLKATKGDLEDWFNQNGGEGFKALSDEVLSNIEAEHFRFRYDAGDFSRVELTEVKEPNGRSTWVAIVIGDGGIELSGSLHKTHNDFLAEYSGKGELIPY
jgi:hypothetical protein